MSTAQTCTPNFAKYYGGSGNDEGLDITSTVDGGSIVAGRSTSDFGDYNGFLLKLTDGGAIQWVKAYGGSQYDELSKVRQTAEGGYIAAGTTKSFGQGSGEAWLVKTDAAGTLLWSMRYRKNGASVKTRDIIQLGDGSYALALNTNDSTAQGDGIVLRIASTGVPLWSKLFNNGGRDGFNTLLEDGNFLLVSGFTTGDFLDGSVTKLQLTDGAVLSSKKYVMRNAMSEEVINVEKIPGGYAVGMLSKWPQITGGINVAQLTCFKLTANDSVRYVRKVNLSTQTGNAIELVKELYTRDSGFAYVANDTLVSSNGIFAKIGPSGMEEWGRNSPGNFQKRRITALGLYASQGYLYTGTVVPLFFSRDRVQVFKTDNAGRAGNCYNNGTFNTLVDTTTYSITPFTWNTVQDEPLITGSLSASLGQLNFTETGVCGKTDCTPATMVSDTACFAGFLSHYKGFTSFSPLNIIRTEEAYYVSGAIQNVKNPEPAVMRIRLNGTVDWARTYNNLISSSGFTILEPTPDGNLLAAGVEYRSIGHVLYHYSTIVKLSPSGDILWAREVRGFINDLHPCGNGEFIGVVVEGFSIGTYTHFFKINEAGTFTYQKFVSPTYQGSSQLISVYRKVLAEAPGSFFAAGENSPNPILEITRFDAAGTRQWTRPFSYNGYVMGVISLHAAGDTLYTMARVYKPINVNFSKVSYLLVKVSKSGQGLNAVEVSVPDFTVETSGSYSFGSQTLTTADLTSSGEIVIADKTKALSDSVVTMLKISKNGQVVWGRRYPNLKNHVMIRLRTDSTGILALGLRRGVNIDGLPQLDPLVMKANDSGKIVTDANNNGYCQSEPVTVITASVALQDVAPRQQLVPYFESWLDPKITNPIRRDFVMTSELACGIAAACSQLKLFGPDFLCNTTDTVLYKVNKNAGCVVPATWAFDTACIQLIRATDTTLSVRFKKWGATSIYAEVKTDCGFFRDSLAIVVLQPANAVSLGPDTTVCPGNTVLLNTHKGYASYLWQDGSTDSTFMATQPGVYYVSVIDACRNRFTDTVRVLPHPPILFNVGPDRRKCNGDTIRFDAPTGFLNYAWSPAYNISSTAQANVVVNPSADTAYFVKAEKEPGCFAYDTIRVHVFHSPAINLGPDVNFCSGDSVTLDAGTGFSSYSWNGIAGAQIKLVKTAGPYSVVGMTAQGCSSFDTLQVLNVWTLPRVSLDKNRELCLNADRTLNAGVFSSHLWQDGSVGQTYKVKSIGQYWVRVTDNHNCIGSDTVNVTTVLPLPNSFLPGDTAICAYGTLVLRPLQTYSFYRWSEGSLAGSITIGQTGAYWLQVIDQKGCTGRDSITVNPKPCMKGVYIPTAFTPNRDGKNDEFKAMVLGVAKKFELTVYNRWGQAIFYTVDPNRGWDGRVAGSLQETNVFVWTCRYRLEGSTETSEKGTVTLIR